MPSDYFGNPDSRNGHVAMENHAYGQSHAVSQGTKIGNNMVGADLAPYEPNGVHHSGMQTGGQDPFDFIHEPKSGKKLSIYSTEGQKLLKKYIKELRKNN